MNRMIPSQLGSVYLFFSMILPVLSLLGVFGLDLGSYYYRQQCLQEHADQAALIASSILPDTKQAREAVGKYLRIYDLDSRLVDLRFNQRSVSIKLSEKTQLIFSRIFQEGYLANTVFSEAVIQPEIVDLVVGGFGSDTLAQDLSVPELFRDYWKAYENLKSSPIELVAKCFDSEMRLLKLISLEIYNFYQTSLDFQTRLINYSDLASSGATHDYCLAIASYESLNKLYKFPTQQLEYRDRVDLTIGLLKAEALTSFSTTEKIWGINKASSVDSLALLSNLKLGINSREYQNQHRPNYKIIFVSNKIPSPKEAASFISLWRDTDRQIHASVSELSNLKTYYLIVDLQALATQRFELWQEAFKGSELEDKELFISKLITSESEAQTALRELFYEKRQYALLR